MEVSDLITAALLNYFVIHPQGHVQQGVADGIPMRVNYREGIEEWREPPPRVPTQEDLDFIEKYKAMGMGTYDGRSQRHARIHAAGFKASDDIGRAIAETEIGPEWYLSTALQKILYPAITKRYVPQAGNPEGDMGRLKEITGNKEVRNAYYLSALADIMKAYNPKQNWEVGVEVMPNTTAVGPMLHMRW